MRFKINWASLINGREFTVFSLFHFLFEVNFQVQAPGGLYLEGRFKGGFFVLQVWGAYIWSGDLKEGFLCYKFRGGLIIFFGVAYTWRGLSSEFYGNCNLQVGVLSILVLRRPPC